MKPERLQKWLRARPPKATHLELHWCSLQGNTLVQRWEWHEVADDGVNGGDIVVQAARDHCDDMGASAQYAVLWVDDQGVTLATKSMGYRPSAEDEKPVGAGSVEAATAAGIVGQALRHNEAMARLYVGSMSGVLGKMHDLLQLQATTIKNLEQKLRSRPDPHDPEDNAESAARAEAIVKVGDAIANHLVPFIATRMNGSGHPSEQ